MTTSVVTDGGAEPSPGLDERHRMPHLPALDGLRGLAVIGVLLFHSGFDWARGGYLGVSTFFTLSGFLITNLLIREWDSQGSIRLGGFWTRRFRRLLPAAVLTIMITGLVFWRIGTPDQLQNLRLDMLGALGYVANWRFYVAGTSYGSLFAAPSPLQHFWSLAIEEQFYLFFPPIVILLMRIGGRRVLGAVVGAATLGSVALCVLLRSDPDRVYYGTDTRVAELLLGVMLALWWSAPDRRRSRTGSLRSDATSRSMVLDIAGMVALLGMFLAWWRLSETSPWLARGGFPVYALCTTTIILAGTGRGLVTRILSNSLLRWAGLISYGLYLYHWPVFLVLSPERVGWAPWPLFALRLAVTITIALASYRLLEMPVRRGRMFTTGRSALSAGIGAVLAVAILAVVITLSPPVSTSAFADVAIGDTAAYGQSHVQDQTPAPGAPRSVFIIGDSGMVDEQTALEAAFHAAGAGHIELGAGPGVGLSQPLDWRGEWTRVVDRIDPDLVIVMMGGWDMKFVNANGAEAYQRLLAETVTILSRRGARILWLPMLPGGKLSAGPVDDAAINAIIASLPDRFPDVVFNPAVGTSLLRPDGTYGIAFTDAAGQTVLLRKPDGWHLCQEGAARLAQEVLDAAVGLGLSPPADRPWRDGPWVDAANFDDPAGACPH
jgi:peptidoglycan/LPS O-acetylase OafA/YrhL/lysophospholipase L1-like esterase